MKPFLSCILAPLALAVALAEEPSEKKPDVPMKRLDNKEVPLEELAHSFFFHSSIATELLAGKIGEPAVERLKPVLAEHKKTLHDTRKLAAKGAQLCADLQRAATSPEFAAVFLKWEEKERKERMRAARELLSQLDPRDRKAVEHYLNSEYRQGSRYSVVDYQAMFGSARFPSADAAALTRRICDDAARAETRVEP
jgi:hypothetical protein